MTTMMTRSEAMKPAYERGANEEQLEVIRHEDGPCRVLASAGSGKTFAAVRRIVRLVNVCGVVGSRILAMTFSVKAGEESTKRLKDLGVTDARVGTWHSLCKQILREDHVTNDRGDVVHDWEIDDKGRARTVLKDVLGWKGMDWKNADFSSINSFITHCKANLLMPGMPETTEFARKTMGRFATHAERAYYLYNEALADKGILTFDDMMVFAIQHLEHDEEARQRWASKWDHVICDEVQDNNGAQQRLSYLLAKDHRNYMAIGDCFQSIFGFRGSSPSYLATFEEQWSEARTIYLPSNYRSCKSIISAANNIVRSAKIEGLESKDMIAMREEEGTVRVIKAESLDDEAREIVNTIQTSVKNGESDFADHTILYRTNAQSRGLEEALLTQRIPYIVVGGTSFYDRKEVRDLLAYLRLACGRGKMDDIKRSINTPFRFLGAKFVEMITDEVGKAELKDANTDWPAIVLKVAVDAKQSRQRASAVDWARMISQMNTTMKNALREDATDSMKKEASPAVLLESIIKQTRYIDYLNREEGSESTENSGAGNVREMVRVAERFATSSELLDYIEETQRKAEKQRNDKQAGGERVLLMTIHRSKGLEWDHVYVVGMNEMILPHAMGEEEEERRLAYVAATRAREVLTMSYVMRIATRAGIKVAYPSRFLVDTGLPLDVAASLPVGIQGPTESIVPS